MKSFKAFFALLVALSFLPAVSAQDRCDRRRNNSYSYDRNHSYDRNYSYNNGYRNSGSYNNRSYDPYYNNDQYYNDNYYRPSRSVGKSAAIIGGSAAAGAVVGGLAKGGKGAAVGAIVGGVGGLIYDQATRNRDRNRY